MLVAKFGREQLSRFIAAKDSGLNTEKSLSVDVQGVAGRDEA